MSEVHTHRESRMLTRIGDLVADRRAAHDPEPQPEPHESKAVNALRSWATDNITTKAEH